MRPDVPAVTGVLSASDITATAGYIAAAQEPSGAIPWYAGGHVDPWDHVECAMALTVGGYPERAEAAYHWLRRTQRADGSWPTKVCDGVVEDDTADVNHCAYVAVGVWHHTLATGDLTLAEAMWDTIRRTVEFVLRLQRPRGEIPWACDGHGRPAEDALLTGGASIHQALRCAAALAERLGRPQPDWELAAARLGHVVAAHEEIFGDRGRYSMDWYYPVLGGAVRGRAAAERLATGWDTFVVPGLGCRCVSDQPWVTGAETCELVLALHAAGRTEAAAELFASIQHLREPDGSYWTGYQYAEDINWPDEHSTWTSAAVILAADALSATSPASRIFADARPLPFEPDHCACTTPSRRG